MINQDYIPDPKEEGKKNLYNQEIQISSDSDLWKSFKSGNNSAFITIYQRFFDVLFSYGIRIKDDEELVKDSIQEVFLDLKKNCQTLGNTDSIKFYLFKCLKRRIFKELKAWENTKQVLDTEHSFEIVFSHEQTLIKRQIDQEKSQLINEAISKLSPRKREIIYYIFYEGMSYQQASELMELHDSKSARDLMYKALRSLRESIGYLPIFFIVQLP